VSTEQLIDRLVSDLEDRSPLSRCRWPRLAIVTALASMVSLAAILLLFTRSPHFAHGPSRTILFSVLAGVALAAVGFAGALKSSHPESRVSLSWLALPAAILMTGLGLEMADTPSSSWAARFWGDSSTACFVCVTLLSLPILGAALAVLREGAPARPRLSGAMAGSLAGGITAALYTLHCPEDSLLFVAFWHVLAVATVCILGALAAGRWLRW